MGHRNAQGIAWNPRNGVAVITEHGSGAADEIDMLERGANYGWPTVQGKAGDARFSDPSLVLHVAPTGAVFVGNSSSATAQQLLIASLTGRVVRLNVEAAGISVAADSVVAGFGRLRDIIAGPGGSVYVSTSNRDWRGKPKRGDDRVLRIRLPARE